MSEYTYTRPMPAHRFIERHLIHLMVTELNIVGWECYGFDDGGEELVSVYDEEDVWDAFEAVDSGRLYVQNDDASGWIYLAGGNGPAVISDYTVNLEPIMQKVFLR